MPIQSKQQPPYYKQGLYVKEYNALITQAGTAAPTAIELKNTIGNIIWTRSAAGTYYGTLSNAFDPEKTSLLVQKQLAATDIVIELSGNDAIALSTTQDGTPEDDRLNKTTILVFVYQ